MHASLLEERAAKGETIVCLVHFFFFWPMNADELKKKHAWFKRLRGCYKTGFKAFTSDKKSEPSSD